MIANIILGALVVILGIAGHRRSPAIPPAALKSAWIRFVELAPRMAAAMLMAGFVGRLIPTEIVARYLGEESGFSGILLASIVGGFVPSGPILAFPVVVVLMQAGAAYPQAVAFITGWSLFAIHRAIIYEFPIMGWRFVVARIIACLPLPPLCGLLTMGVMRVWQG